MSTALTNAALRAGAVMNDAIESSFEDHELLVIDMREELIIAYDALCKVLSGMLGVDAHKMIQRMNQSEVETARAILRAQGVVL